jgi:hypothetical protein
MAALDVAEDGRVVSLSLSAEPATLFRDERGAGRVPFGQFLRAAGAAG